VAGFSAGDVVESLDYDFSNTKVPVKGLEDCKGTIPEPTPLQVERFLSAGRKEAVRSRLEAKELGFTDEDMTPEQILAALDKIDPARTAAARKRNAQILSDLCSGEVTAAQILKLPHRLLRDFSNWITAEVLNPEAGAGGTNAQVLPLRSSAAG
jgi:hypothetical protein